MIPRQAVTRPAAIALAVLGFLACLGAETPPLQPPPLLQAPTTPDPSVRKLIQWIVRPEWKQLTEAERRNDAAAVETLVAENPGLAEARALANPEPLLNWAAARDATNLVVTLLRQGALQWKRRDDLPRRPGALTAAIHTGATQSIALLLAAGADPNRLDDDTRQPPVVDLINHWEVLRVANGVTPRPEGNAEDIARQLLRSGANLLQGNPENASLLLRPTGDVVPLAAHEYLLTHAVPSAQRHTDGFTLLHAAVVLGATNALPVLLGRGLEVNATNRFGETPLHTLASLHPLRPLGFAYESFDPEWRERHAALRLPLGIRQTLARQLLAAGARPDIFSAAGLGDTATLAALARTNPALVNARDPQGRTPLHWAVLGDDVASVRTLVRLGAQLDAVDQNGHTPLHLSLVGWRKETTGTLLAAHAPLNILDLSGRTPLSLAAHAPDAVDLLLGNGAPARDSGTRPALVEAVRYLISDFHSRQQIPGPPLASRALEYREGPVRALLGAGANPLATGPDGHSALDLALSNGALNLLELLVDHGVDLNRKDPSGQPLWFGALQGPAIVPYHPPISWQLRWVRRLPEWLAAPIARRGWMPAWPPVLRVPVLPALANYGADFAATNAAGENALHRLALRGPRNPFDDAPTNAVELLIDAGARIDQRDKLGFTPWLRAWRSGAVRLAIVLPRLGANPLATTDAGDNALHLAVQAASDNLLHLPPLLPILQDLGVDPHQSNAAGVDPVALARTLGLHPVADQLEQPRPPSAESPAKPATHPPPAPSP